MTNNTRVIWCILKGDSVPFRIAAHIDATVDELKELIRSPKESGALRGIDAADLVLRKAST